MSPVPLTFKFLEKKQAETSDPIFDKLSLLIYHYQYYKVLL